MNNSCETCMYYDGDKDSHGEKGICRRNPPTVFAFPMQGIAGGMPKFMLQTFWPPVKADMGCGCYEQKPEIEKEN